MTLVTIGGGLVDSGRVARGTFQQPEAHGRVELEAEPGDYGARDPLLWGRGYEPELDDDEVPAAEKADQSIRADGLEQRVTVVGRLSVYISTL